MSDRHAEDVLQQMADDYARGRWTLSQFEQMVDERLHGRTPVDKEGWPLYYEPALLDGCEQVAP